MTANRDIDMGQPSGSVNGLLPDGTKPLPKPMLTSHLWGSVELPESDITVSGQANILYNEFQKIMYLNYPKLSNISRTLVGNGIVDHSDVVGASPVSAAPTTSSFST